MRVRLNCSLDAATDASRSLADWISSAEAGELDGDEALAGLASITDLIDAQRAALRRALGS